MSDDNDYRALFMTGTDAARGGEAQHAADPFATPGAEEATEVVSTSARTPLEHPESERTTVVTRAEVDAALAAPSPADTGDGPSPAPAAESAPLPNIYWLNGSSRHGYDDPPRIGQPGGEYSAPPSQPVSPGLPRMPERGAASSAPPAVESGPPPPAGPAHPTGPDPRLLHQQPPPPPQPNYPGAGDPRHHPGAYGPNGGTGVSVGEMRARIRESQIAPPYKPVPQTGWRKGVYKTTRINLGLSATERHWNDLARRLKVNLRGKYVIAVMGVKGGASKTTSTICLGAALSRYRTDKIVAVDANPASGNLGRRVDEPVTLSWRGLIEDRNLQEYTDFRAYLGRQTSTGLEVLASDVGDQMMTGRHLLSAVKLLQRQYPIALLDCGNQVRDEMTHVMLQQLGVDAVVVPSTTRLDGAQGAAETLNWLMTHGFPHLVREAVVVVSNVNRIDATAQVKGLHEDFARSVRAVHDVPFDEHLSDAVAIDFERLRPTTRQVYIEAAASLVDGFASAADRDAGAARWPGPAGGRP